MDFLYKSGKPLICIVLWASSSLSFVDGYIKKDTLNISLSSTKRLANYLGAKLKWRATYLKYSPKFFCRSVSDSIGGGKSSPIDLVWTENEWNPGNVAAFVLVSNSAFNPLITLEGFLERDPYWKKYFSFHRELGFEVQLVLKPSVDYL